MAYYEHSMDNMTGYRNDWFSFDATTERGKRIDLRRRTNPGYKRKNEGSMLLMDSA